MLALLLIAGVTAAEEKKAPVPDAFDWASKGWSRADYTVANLKPYAVQGYARAQTILGFVHLYGNGTKKDPVRAAHWFAKAAAQNYAPAQHALARLYLAAAKADAKAGAKQKKGVALMRAAARGNHPIAQVEFGLMFERGQFVKRDSARAVLWFERAARQSFAPGQFLYALALAKGRGVARNQAAAHRWGLQAAKGGYGEAQYWLGYRFLKGDGVKESPVDGLTWLFIAAHGGDVRARRVLARYRARVFEDVWKRAKAKAAAFKPPKGPKPVF